MNRFALFLVLALGACVHRPNRTEPKWTVTPEVRTATTLKIHAPVVPEVGVECAERELMRVKSFGATVERELWEAGFEILKPTDEPVDGGHADARIEIAKLDCRDALRGDLTLTVERDRAELGRAHLEGAVFSNFRVAANQLVDELLMSGDFSTPAVATSSTSTTSG